MSALAQRGSSHYWSNMRMVARFGIRPSGCSPASWRRPAHIGAKLQFEFQAMVNFG
jgi:hypothetical protein